ncbi:MAG: Mannose-1-phosphate guanylyltransferase, partial [uncultured Phycisphaerae bacterium]
AVRRDHGGRRGDEALAAVPEREAEAAPAGRPRQEPAAAQLRAAPGGAAGRPHLRLHRRAAPAPRAGEPAGTPAGQPARRADRPGHGRRRRVPGRRPAQAGPGRDHGDHDGRPRDRAAGEVPIRLEGGVRGRRAAAGQPGHVRHRPDPRAHRARVHPAGRHAEGEDGRRLAGRVQGAGVQGEAGQADGRPVRRERPVLLEQRDVRLAVRHRARRAGPAPAGDARRAHEDRRGVGLAAAGRGAEPGLPDAPEDQHRLRRDGAGQPGQGQGDGGRRRDAGPVAGRRLVARAGRDAADRRAQQRDRGRGVRVRRRRRQHRRQRGPGPPRVPDRRQRHDRRPHAGHDHGLPQERGPAGEGHGRAGEGEVRGAVPV